MGWELRLSQVFDDLEQQAEGLALAARDVEVADLARQEYAEIDLAARLHGSLGAVLTVRTAAGPVQGRLARVGLDWFLLAHADGWPSETLVRVAAVRSIIGLTLRAQPEQVRAVTARLSAGSVLRAVAETGEEVAVADLGDVRRRGEIRRVGRDFIELVVNRDVQVVPVTAIALLERG